MIHCRQMFCYVFRQSRVKRQNPAMVASDCVFLHQFQVYRTYLKCHSRSSQYLDIPSGITPTVQPACRTRRPYVFVFSFVTQRSRAPFLQGLGRQQRPSMCTCHVRAKRIPNVSVRTKHTLVLHYNVGFTIGGSTVPDDVW